MTGNNIVGRTAAYGRNFQPAQTRNNVVYGASGNGTNPTGNSAYGNNYDAGYNNGYSYGDLRKDEGQNFNTSTTGGYQPITQVGGN